MRKPIPGLGRLLCCVTVLAACAKSDAGRAADSAAAAAPVTPSPAPAATPAAATPLSLADVAGKWNMRSVPESGDTTPTTYVLTAASDASGWKLTFPNGLTVPAKGVMAAGDSVVTDAGPYASVRRKGVQVTTHSVFRRQGAQLVGTTVAHYKTTGPDSVLRLRSEGTRAP
ncbi:MAG: hypothetical protein ABJD07_06825 [Gemmatimonadaceae bacterium]